MNLPQLKNNGLIHTNMLLNIFQTGPLDVNTYVLKDEETNEAVIIDLSGEFE